MAENIKSLTGDITDGLPIGEMSKGEIVRITLAKAEEIMTPEQVILRKVRPEMMFIEMEICVTSTKTFVTKSFRYYEGNVPANSTQGQIITTYGDLEEDSEVNMITRTAGKPGNEFVVWDLVTV